MSYRMLCSLRQIMIAIVKQLQIAAELVAYHMRHCTVAWSALSKKKFNTIALFYNIIKWIHNYYRADAKDIFEADQLYILRTILCSHKNVHKIDFLHLRIWCINTMLLTQRYWTTSADCWITSPNIRLISVYNCKWNDNHHWLLHWCANNFSIVYYCASFHSGSSCAVDMVLFESWNAHQLTSFVQCVERIAYKPDISLQFDDYLFSLALLSQLDCRCHFICKVASKIRDSSSLSFSVFRNLVDLIANHCFMAISILLSAIRLYDVVYNRSDRCISDLYKYHSHIHTYNRENIYITHIYRCVLFPGTMEIRSKSINYTIYITQGNTSNGNATYFMMT